MKRVLATLPTLGTINVDFYNESADLFKAIGEKELTRLKQVPHLGVASQVFTGANHSRLEYLLLQCAMVGLIAKLHKNQEGISISSKVRISGSKKEISSGEELLKCWLLLSSFGRAQYTYGTERVLLQELAIDNDLRNWVLSHISRKDLKTWTIETINEYQDKRFHYVLSLVRLDHLNLPPHKKSRYINILRNLILPINRLSFADSAQRDKILGMRSLFSWIRNISMITLDSYYSHYPLRIQQIASIINLGDISAATIGSRQYDKFSNAMSGWLANELYLNPRAVAAQKGYEIRGRSEYQSLKAKSIFRKTGFIFVLNSVMKDGFGKPIVNSYLPLLRLTLVGSRLGFMGRTIKYSRALELEKRIANPPITCVSIDYNEYSRETYVDIVYRKAKASVKDISTVYLKLVIWLLRQIEADALRFGRSILGPSVGHSSANNERILQRTLERQADVIEELFASILRYLLPEGYAITIMPIDPGSSHPCILTKATLPSGQLLDNFSSYLDSQITAHSKPFLGDRRQELEAIKWKLSNCRSNLILGAIGKIIVRDSYGKSVDEWDGAIFYMKKNTLSLNIIEAKNYGGATRNENEALKQLNKTRSLLRKVRNPTTRKQKIPGLGASLSVEL
jgi:hypothetical protein